MCVETHKISGLYFVVPSIVLDVKNYPSFRGEVQKVTLIRSEEYCCIARRELTGKTTMFVDELSGTPIRENMFGHVMKDEYYVNGDKYVQGVLSYIWQINTGTSYFPSMEEYLTSLKPEYSSDELISILENYKLTMKKFFPVKQEYVKRIKFRNKSI